MLHLCLKDVCYHTYGCAQPYRQRNPSITAVDLSQAVGVTERAVRKAIADLASTGYISKAKEGRRVRYQINTKMFLRHPSHREVQIAEFLKALGCKDEGKVL